MEKSRDISNGSALQQTHFASSWALCFIEVSLYFISVQQISFECVPKSQLCFQDSVLLRICDGRSQTISCPFCKPKINIISANYGRLTGGHICLGPVKTTNCGAVGSLDKVRHACQGKKSCNLTASLLVFGYDPCLDTKKYLEVRVFQYQI